MNQFDSTKQQTMLGQSREGWLVQIYGRDRRLLCVLEPSHAWTFLLGCGVGLLLAIGWLNLSKHSPSITYDPPATPPETWVD